ncbi:MAG: TetR/AcrR family transcriptional regulator [Microthrixaceae bacterium]
MLGSGSVGTDPVEARSKGEQTRATILETAIERFGRAGYRAVSVAEIARAVGVGAPAVFSYFPSKEALFLAALDQDAGEVMQRALLSIAPDANPADWREQLALTLVTVIEGHPLAERVLSGLEPRVTDRVLDLGALDRLTAAVAERLRHEQQLGLVRPDIDPEPIASGIITILIALLMGVLQFGPRSIDRFRDGVLAVFAAALDAPPT